MSLSAIDDLDAHVSTAADDLDKYRAVAGWLIFVAIAGMATQIVMAIVRALYYGEAISSHAFVFGLMVSLCSYT